MMSIAALSTIIIFMVLLPPVEHLFANAAARPNVDDVALFARWLVSESNFGVLSTLGVKGAVEDRSAPFGTVASFADAGTGTPYFYLSPELDPLGNNSATNSRASFALSEALLGLCNAGDAQSPLCARLTLSGRLKMEKQGSAKEKFGEAALFAKHPMLTGFPKRTGKFRVFRLLIEDIYLVNKSAPRRNVTVGEYYEL